MSYVHLVHINDTVGTKPKEIFEGNVEVYEIDVYNTHATQTLYISFDGGSNYRTIAATKERKFRGFVSKPISIRDKINVKGSAADTTFEIILIK